MNRIEITTKGDLELAKKIACEKLNITKDELSYIITKCPQNSVTIEAWKKLEQSKLRKCPDCEREISRKAESCPHCGCPIEKTSTCARCGYDTDLTYIQIQERGYSVMCENCGYKIRVSTPEDEMRWKLQKLKEPKTAECPYCHSKNTKKIGSISKASSVAIWGIFAIDKVSKQWHCNNCGSDF